VPVNLRASYKLSLNTINFFEQAQLKLADHLRKMGEQGKDIEGMDVDLNQVRTTVTRQAS